MVSGWRVRPGSPVETAFAKAVKRPHHPGAKPAPSQRKTGANQARQRRNDSKKKSLGQRPRLASLIAVITLRHLLREEKQGTTT